MLTIDQTLTAARNGVTKSRGASQRSKTSLDNGYPHRRERENAIEELRQSVEQLIAVVEILMSAPSMFVSNCHGGYITPIPRTDMWRCYDCDKACVPIRQDKHPRWAKGDPE